MSHAKRYAPATTARLVSELGIAAPIVVFLRLGQMAWDGFSPTGAHRGEYTTMVTEKQAAFTRAWQAMFAESWKIQSGFQRAWLQAWMQPGGWANPAVAMQFTQQWLNAPFAVANRGLRPVHRRAARNARRLTRSALH